MRLILTISAAGLLGFASPSAQAQAREPAGSLATIDPSTAESGDRVSKMIGATVVNDQNETVGRIDDVILKDEKPYLVLSVGGFLGVGNKLVVLPYGAVRKTDERLIMPSATKEALRSLPEFQYLAK